MFVELYNKLNEERTTNNINLLSAIKKMTEETGFEKDIKRLENEKVKLNDRLSNLVDMKLDKIIYNDIYIKKEKELLNKIDEVINTTPRLEEFNEDCFRI